MENQDFDKIFVLDTNVLLHDARAIFKFQDNLVVLPLVVIEEVDHFKKGDGETSRNSRQVSRYLDDLRVQGDISVGIELDNGGYLKVDVDDHLDTGKVSLMEQIPDNKILGVACRMQQENPGKKVILVSKDTNLRIKANVLGVEAEDYSSDKVVDTDDLYTGVIVHHVSGEVIDQLYKSREVNVDDIEDLPDMFPNQYVVLKNLISPQRGIARFDKKKNKLVPLKEFPKGVWGIKPKNLEQTIALDMLLNDDLKLVTLIGKAGTGKAQPLSSKILTPDGWKTMGEIKPEDYVVGVDGLPKKVLGIYPQGEKNIYEVTFSDGSKTKCCNEHLWETKTSVDRANKSTSKIRELSSIKETLNYRGRKNHSIPMVSSVPFQEKVHLIDPYLLGCLIGDGGLTAQVSFSNTDGDILTHVKESLDKNYQLTAKKNNLIDYTVTSIKNINGKPSSTFVRQSIHDPKEIKIYTEIKAIEGEGFVRSSVYRACSGEYKQYKGFYWFFYLGEEEVFSSNIYKNELIKLGLYGKKADKKFIPTDYLIDSIDNRISLLQGILDTDGYISKKGSYSLSTSSLQLANDFKDLIWSLGGTLTCKKKKKSYTYKGEKKQGLDSYTLHIVLPDNIIAPFRCQRKLERFEKRVKYFPTRFIVKVSPIGREDCQCIYIDCPRHLYVTDDYIVTHNTLIAVAAGLQKSLDDQIYKKLIVSRPIVPMGKDLGFLPGTLAEKMAPWIQPIFDNIDYLINGHNVTTKGMTVSGKDLIDQNMLEVEPLTYIRGRTIPYQFMIIDEAQNLSAHEIKTIITRAGEGTKIVLTGDCEQIDSPYLDAISNGLTYTVEKFKGQEIAGHITLLKGERSELAEIASNIL